MCVGRWDILKFLSLLKYGDRIDPTALVACPQASLRPLAVLAVQRCDNKYSGWLGLSATEYELRLKGDEQ
jgi:hypothetical protein